MNAIINGKQLEITSPKRVTHSYKQTIQSSLEKVMSLYCPVEELRWVEHWHPKKVFSQSGVVENDAVFITEDNGNEITWYVTHHDIKTGYVEMIFINPSITISKLQIITQPISENSCTSEITYSITSLGSEGDKKLEQFSYENYEKSMIAWEKSINHYLKTGKMLKGLPKF